LLLHRREREFRRTWSGKIAGPLWRLILRTGLRGRVTTPGSRRASLHARRDLGGAWLPYRLARSDSRRFVSVFRRFGLVAKITKRLLFLGKPLVHPGALLDA